MAEAWDGCGLGKGMQCVWYEGVWYEGAGGGGRGAFVILEGKVESGDADSSDDGLDGRHARWQT